MIGLAGTHVSLPAVAQGVWSPQKIANPKFYEDSTPLANIGKINAVAIEIWTMDSEMYFDNIVVSNDPAVAAELRERTWAPKKVIEVRVRFHHLTELLVSDLGCCRPNQCFRRCSFAVEWISSDFCFCKISSYTETKKYRT